MNIEQIAYEQASGEMLDYCSKEQLAAFLHRCLSKLAEKEVEPVGSIRYRVEKTGHGFWPYCVRAGTGTNELFVGHQKQCTKVANALATAFEDGKFIAQQRTAEACAKVAVEWGSARKDQYGGNALRNCAEAIRSGEWREYL